MTPLILSLDEFLRLTGETPSPQDPWESKTADEICAGIRELLNSKLVIFDEAHIEIPYPVQMVRTDAPLLPEPREVAKSRARAILGPKRGRWA